MRERERVGGQNKTRKIQRKNCINGIKSEKYVSVVIDLFLLFKCVDNENENRNII